MALPETESHQRAQKQARPPPFLEAGVSFAVETVIPISRTS